LKTSSPVGQAWTPVVLDGHPEENQPVTRLKNDAKRPNEDCACKCVSEAIDAAFAALDAGRLDRLRIVLERLRSECGAVPGSAIMGTPRSTG
jgi:hypothetical protein